MSLAMETSGDVGFTQYARVERLEAQPLFKPSPSNLAVQASAGVRAWCRPAASQSEDIKQRQRSGWEAGPSSLGDGRLDVGTHLPLLGKRYHYLSLLGEGTSAQVVLAQDTLQPSQDMVAIKILRRQFSYAGQKESRALRWLASVAPYAAITRIQGVFFHANHVCLVMPRLYQSLLDVVVHSTALDKDALVSQVRDIAMHLLATLADLHAHGVVHADLKPENILLANPLVSGAVDAADLRLIDLGSCFSVTAMDTAQLTFEAQTLPYRAPEVLRQQPCGPQMDMWSLGCILAELLLHQPLFTADSPVALLQQIKDTLDGSGSTAEQSPPRAMASSSRIQPKEGRLGCWLDEAAPLHLALARLDLAAADLVMQLLRTQPAARLTAAQALRHPFFAARLPLRHLWSTQPAIVPSADAAVQVCMIKHEAGELVQSDGNADDKGPAAEHPQVAITADCGLSTSAARKRKFGCRGRAPSQEQGRSGVYPGKTRKPAALRGPVHATPSTKRGNFTTPSCAAPDTAAAMQGRSSSHPATNETIGAGDGPQPAAAALPAETSSRSPTGGRGVEASAAGRDAAFEPEGNAEAGVVEAQAIAAAAAMPEMASVSTGPHGGTSASMRPQAGHTAAEQAECTENTCATPELNNLRVGPKHKACQAGPQTSQRRMSSRVRKQCGSPDEGWWVVVKQ